MTLYDPAGYLLPNAAELYSVGSAGLSAAEQQGWAVTIAPDRAPGHWLPTAGAPRFELTLRTYLPQGPVSAAELPRIEKERCA